MFKVFTEKNNLRVEGNELLTSGSVNINFVQLNTSDDWLGLNRVILFRTNRVSIAISLGVDNGTPMEFAIPWEVLEFAGETIQVGLYGTSQVNLDDVVMPTIWGNVGKVVQGVFLSGSTGPSPTDNLFLDLIEEIDTLKKKIDDDIPQFNYLTDADIDRIVAENESSTVNQNGR